MTHTSPIQNGRHYSLWRKKKNPIFVFVFFFMTSCVGHRVVGVSGDRVKEEEDKKESAGPCYTSPKGEIENVTTS